MSKFIEPSIFLLLLFSPDFVFAQGHLWGSTSKGGTNDIGVIFRVNSDGSEYDLQKSFASSPQSPGAYPGGNNLIQAPNGKLYGMTNSGGANDHGVLFEYDPVNLNYVKKLDFFSSTSGAFPNGNLTLAPNGKFYGITNLGGANNQGVLFEFDPTLSSSFTKKLDFEASLSGSRPTASLTLASNGKLYGLTSSGGANNSGVLFEYDPSNDTYLKRFDFSAASSGAGPYGSLVEAANGMLYGVTAFGGASNIGALFEYDFANGIFTKKIDFNFTNGGFGFGGLTKSTNGKLYGMTSYGGGASGLGVLFEYDPANGNLTKKLDFNGTATGSQPKGSLMLSSSGVLFGMTSLGGVNNQGIIFEYDPSSSTFSKKLDFASSNGATPNGNLMQASNGKFYGMTNNGGTYGAGIIFEYNSVSGNLVKKNDFVASQDGVNPSGSLTNVKGKLYGVTTNGGAHNDGVIFEYDHVNGIFNKKIDFFATSTGAKPNAGLILTSTGKVYGTTFSGGANNAGVLFEYNPDDGTYLKRIDFVSASTGANPKAPLVEANGKLYGTTSKGGINNNGTLFEYNPLTGDLVKKIDFLYTASGSQPNGLTLHSNGKIYGVTDIGGLNGAGVLFEYDFSLGSFAKKIDFDGITNGASFFGLTEAFNGKLYGMAYNGGPTYAGLIFEYDPLVGGVAVKFEFDGNLNGGYPKGGLTLSSNGKLYGMTYFGGANNLGVLFEFDPVNKAFIKKMDFTGINGANPQFGDLLFVKANQTISFEPLSNKIFGDAPFTLTGSSQSGLPITYSSSDPSVASIIGNTITILKPGSTTISASQAGDASYNPAVDVQKVLVIEKASPTISFAPLPNKIFGDAPFVLTATSQSGLPITYSSSDLSVASIIGNTITILKPGSATITASQAGDAWYNPADAQQTLVIEKVDQTISFASVSRKTFGDLPFNLVASSGSGLPVSFTSSDMSVVKIDQNRVTVLKAGTVTVTAIQEGNEYIKPATKVAQTLVVDKANQSITFSSLINRTIGDQSFILTATASSNLVVSYSTLSDRISILSNEVTLVKPGRVAITASQEGDSNYNLSLPVAQSFCIKPAKPEISIIDINSESPTLISSSPQGNQWYLDDIAIENGTSQTFKAKEAGVYKVKVAVDDCVSEFSSEQPLAITGETNNFNSISVKIFPNPASDWLTVYLGDKSVIKTVTVFQIDGREKDKFEIFENSVMIDVSNYYSGIYAIKISTENSVEVHKFIKH